MPDTPKLAVVISCYNYEAFVGRAIRSVLDQHRGDCEVIVVDDGSTDGSWEIIQRSGAPCVRIANSGQRAACLYGFDRTRAPFVLFLDADDELKPGALGAIIERLDPDVAKLQFSLTRIDAAGRVLDGASSHLDTFRNRDRLARQVLRTGVYKTPPTSGNVFRRDVCEFLRDAAYDRAVDGVILFAAPFRGDIVSVAEELGNYRVHDRNDSGVGRAPDVRSLERELERFVARMEHLRAIIEPYDRERALAPAKDVFYFRERRFYIAVAAGRRPPLAELPALLRKLAGETYPTRTKLGIAALFVLATLLPKNRAKALLAYRFQIGNRSPLGFVRRVIAPR